MSSTSESSATSIHVELPAYGYSFVVNVPSDPSSSVLSIKEAISVLCPGYPASDGQRIIWRGRVLRNEEKIENLWPNNGEEVKRIVHLSVHPSAWSGDPPKTQEKGKGKEREDDVDLVAKLTAAAPSAYRSTPTPTPTPAATTVMKPVSASHSSRASPAHPTYILSKHRQALSTLTHQPFEGWFQQGDRELAVKFVEGSGFVWPTILDEEITPTATGQGVKYAKQIIDGRPYLSLLNPTAIPTDSQIHALKVLSYTIELLKLPQTPAPGPSSRTSHPAPAPSSSGNSSGGSTGTPVQIPAHLNALLQQMGLPPIQDPPLAGPVQVQIINDGVGVPLPVAQGQGGQFLDLNAFLNANGGQLGQNPPAVAPNPPPQVQAAQIRPLLLPIFMLSLRTLLLLYFVAPARKPFLTLMIIAWVMWEIWVPIRAVFRRVGRAVDALEQAQGGGQGQGGPAGANFPRDGQVPVVNRGAQPVRNEAPAAAPADPPPPAGNNPAAVVPNAAAGSIVNTLASFDIAEGEAALQAFADHPVHDHAGTQDVFPEPNLGRKALSFVVLLVTTVHPAVWNKRRATLRAREGRVRVEMGALRETAATQQSAAIEDNGDSSNSEDASAATLEAERRTAQRAEILSKYMRRPMWVRRYMQRVFHAGEGEGAAWGAGEEWVAEE
ncbi:hypothetical protein GYMLUDRAFT_219407 [Collybiopsis luxurians FD-317 M1]|nr:hypothetical protein GYMLUDRAFT_219407 [Collybiopsis luxurians FD-317 M1]